jgi:hypothetical protein
LGGGNSGSINSHSESSRIGLAIVGPPCPWASSTIPRAAVHAF